MKPNFKAFTDAILDQSWKGQDLDCGEIQEIAINHGIIIEVETNGVCEPNADCSCLEILGEIPDTCYRKNFKDEVHHG